MAQVVTASEFKKHYGQYSDTALREPVVIQKHNRNSLVVLSYEVFEKIQKDIQDLMDTKNIEELNKIKEAGMFTSGAEAIDRLNSLIK